MSVERVAQRLLHDACLGVFPKNPRSSGTMYWIIGQWIRIELTKSIDVIAVYLTEFMARHGQRVATRRENLV